MGFSYITFINTGFHLLASHLEMVLFLSLHYFQSQVFSTGRIWFVLFTTIWFYPHRSQFTTRWRLLSAYTFRYSLSSGIVLVVLMIPLEATVYWVSAACLPLFIALRQKRVQLLIHLKALRFTDALLAILRERLECNRRLLQVQLDIWPAPLPPTAQLEKTKNLHSCARVWCDAGPK